MVMYRVWFVIAAICSIFCLKADPVLLLQNQLEQLQAGSYTPSKEALKLKFARSSPSFKFDSLWAENDITGWVNDAIDYLVPLTNPVTKKNELNGILAISQQDLSVFIHEIVKHLNALNELDLSEQSNKNYELSVFADQFGDDSLKSLRKLIQLCNGLQGTCSWLSDLYNELKAPLAIIKEKVLKQKKLREINKKFYTWKERSKSWKTDKEQLHVLTIAGTVFVPDKISPEQEKEIEAACSWQGLAQVLDVDNKENDLQDRVVATLMEAQTISVRSYQKREFIAEIDGVIIAALNTLVDSLIPLYPYEGVIKNGENVINGIEAWDITSFEKYMNAIAVGCQLNIGAMKYDDLVKLFKKSNIWEEYGGNIKNSWCTAIEKTAFAAYETFMKEMVYHMPENIVGDPEEYEKYLKPAKQQFTKDWRDYRCSFNFKVISFFNRLFRDEPSRRAEEAIRKAREARRNK